MVAARSRRCRRCAIAGRHTKLTPEVHQQIVAFIRAGAYDWVAAEAAGIGKSTFYRWLERGAARAAEPHRTFLVDVRQARAQSRVAAETEVRRDQPLAWLRYAPGRERPGAPGWTESHALQGPDGGPLRFTLQLERKPAAEEDGDV